MTTGFKNGTLSVFLKGEMDHHRAASIREEIDGAVRAYLPEKLVLDFGGVTFCDSSGIAVVTGRRKLMKSVGGEVELTNLTRPVEAVFRMANLEKLVTIRRDD